MTDNTSDGDGGRPGRAVDDPGCTYELEPAERHSLAVVRAVASLTNTAVSDIEPLYDSGIDIDALDGLFAGTRDSDDLEVASVNLTLNGCQVSVTQSMVFAREREPDAR